MAATPTLGGYTSDASDNISTAGGVCAANSGFSCSTSPIQEAGFLQMIIEDTSTGQKYIHSVLTEGETANGGADFTSAEGVGIENFVKMGGGSGILAQQNVQENTSTGTTTGGTDSEVFKTAAFIAAGDFQSTGVTNIQIDQSIVETLKDSSSATIDQMTSNMRLTEVEQDFGGTNGKLVTALVQIENVVTEAEFTGSLSMESYKVETDNVVLATANDYKKIDADATLVGEVEQTFALRERVGAASLASGGGNMTGDAGAAASNVSWTAGDTIVNLIIEQSVTDATGAAVGVFGLNDFANESTGGANGVDKFTSSDASTFQVSNPVNAGEDPFAANDTTNWFQ
jgi:hypothetical protein